MKNPRKLIQKKVLFLLKTIYTTFLFLTFSISTIAQNPNSSQWASAGGEKILSGNHSFTASWASHTYSRQDGNKWWRGGFWGKREPLIPWENAVKNSVAPVKGQITVLGPGNVGLYQKAKGPRIYMTDTKTKAGFTPWTNSLGWSNNKWEGTVKDYNINGEFWGFVPAGTEITLDITAIMSVYNNQGGTGEISYTAPQDIEYEIWFFPKEGGKVISVTTSGNKSSAGGNEKPDNKIPDFKGNFMGRLDSGTLHDKTDNKRLKPGDRIIPGHEIIAGMKGLATFTIFAKNNKGEVQTSSHQMQPGSVIKIKKEVKKKQFGMSVILGRLFNVINGPRSKNGFKIEIFNSVAAVEGTTFETSFDENTGISSLIVFEGLVSFSCINSEMPPLMVSAGITATFNKNCIPGLNATNTSINTPAKAGWNTSKPSISGGGLFPIADSHVYAYDYSGWSKANWGKYDILGAGWNPTGGEKRAYLKFDVSGVNASTFEKATLKLFHYHTGGGNAAELGVYTVRTPWNEGNGNYNPSNVASSGELCWINQPTSDRYPVRYFNPGMNINDYEEVDITPLVKSWLEGMPNNGMVIKAGESYINGAASVYGFYSREHADIEKRPQLILSGSNLEPVQQTAGTSDTDITFGTADFNEFSLKGNIYYLPGNTSSLPDFKNMSPVGSIYTKELNIPTQSFSVGFPGVTDRFEWFGISYNGSFYIQQGGQYSFRLASDDGAKLWIDNQLIINNDGIHQNRSKSAAVYLNPGQHYIQVDYFQGPRMWIALQLFVTEPGKAEKIFSPEYSSNQTSGGFGTNNFSSGSDNLLVNGSFEDPVIGAYQSFGVGQDIAGWKVMKASVDLTGSYFQSSEGKQSMDLHGTGGFGGIQQSFATVPQQKYNVVFDFAGNAAGGPTVKEMRVSAAGQSQDFKFDCTGKSVRNMGWTTQSWEFTSNQKITTLVFETLSSSGMDRYGPAIDNVKVYSSDGQNMSNMGNAAIHSTDGRWQIDQSNGFNGSMNIQQHQSGQITGNVIWNGNLKGTIDGKVSGNAIEFTISYPNGDKGLYKGTLTQNGTRIINGTVKGNNGDIATWEGSANIQEP